MSCVELPSCSICFHCFAFSLLLKSSCKDSLLGAREIGLSLIRSKLTLRFILTSLLIFWFLYTICFSFWNGLLCCCCSITDRLDWALRFGAITISLELTIISGVSLRDCSSELFILTYLGSMNYSYYIMVSSYSRNSGSSMLPVICVPILLREAAFLAFFCSWIGKYAKAIYEAMLDDAMLPVFCIWLFDWDATPSVCFMCICVCAFDWFEETVRTRSWPLTLILGARFSGEPGPCVSGIELLFCLVMDFLA